MTTEATGAAACRGSLPPRQAEYLTDAFQRARREWPWLQMLAVWNLGGELHPEWRGYSLLDGDGQPKLAFDACGVWALGGGVCGPLRLLRAFGCSSLAALSIAGPRPGR